MNKDDELGAAREEANRLREALEAYQRFNRINTDTDSYLHDLAEWALGEEPVKPDEPEWIRVSKWGKTK